MGLAAFARRAAPRFPLFEKQPLSESLFSAFGAGSFTRNQPIPLIAPVMQEGVAGRKPRLARLVSGVSL